MPWICQQDVLFVSTEERDHKSTVCSLTTHITRYRAISYPGPVPWKRPCGSVDVLLPLCMFNSSSRSRTFLHLFHGFTQVWASFILAFTVQKSRFENKLIRPCMLWSFFLSSHVRCCNPRALHALTSHSSSLRDKPLVDLLVAFSLRWLIFITCFCLSSSPVSLIVKPVTGQHVQVSSYYSDSLFLSKLNNL